MNIDNDKSYNIISNYLKIPKIDVINNKTDYFEIKIGVYKNSNIICDDRCYNVRILELFEFMTYSEGSMFTIPFDYDTFFDQPEIHVVHTVISR